MRRRAVQYLKDKKLSQKEIKPKLIHSFFHEKPQELENPSQRIHINYSPTFLQTKKTQLILSAIQVNVPQLTCSQVRTLLKMFVINKKAQNKLGWDSPQYCEIEDYKEYINPIILKGRNPEVEEEQNISFPLIKAKIHRFSSIDVEYELLNRQKVRQTLQGFQARLFQNNYDFMYGRGILDWRLHHGNLRISEDAKQHFPKSSEICESYCKQLDKIFKDFPQLIKVPNQADAGWFKMDSQKLSIESDHVLRLNKYFTRQMLILMQKAQLGLVKSK